MERFIDPVAGGARTPQTPCKDFVECCVEAPCAMRTKPAQPREKA